MTFFKYFTPITYWLLVLMWSFIFLFYISRLKSKKLNGRLLVILLTILAIDSFRTLFESAYFGLWYTSLVGFLPKTVYIFLIRPEIVFIPKVLNVIAAIAVIVILIYRWIPQEEHEKKYLNDLIDKQTEKISESNLKLKNEIDERKLIEEELRQNEKDLRASQRIAHLGSWHLDLETNHVVWTEELYAMYGFDPTFPPPPYTEHMKLFTPESWERLSTSLARTSKTGLPYELELETVRKDGNDGWMWVRGEAEKDSEGKIIGLWGAAQDITDRKKAENEIKKQKRLFETMFNTIPDGVVVTNTQREIQLANKGMESTFGYKPEELIGKVTKILYATQDKFKETGKNVFGKDSKKPGDLYITRYKDKNGREFSGETFGAKLYDENNQWIGNLGIMRDVTEREHAEMSIQQAQKMESIGSLAGGIAHDFNNILSPVVGMSEMLLEDLPKDSPQHEDAQDIFNAGLRGSELVKQILTFSRQHEHKMIPIRIQQVLKEVLKLTRSSIPTNIEICQDIDQNCGKVIADATQIHQIGMNLITNAYHAVQDKGGRIDVEVREITINDGLNELALLPGKYITLKVADNGIGIRKEHLDRIFDPYFTTKEQGKGTGLGLSVVYGIVKEHKGDIKVMSETGKGTSFQVYLPVMTSSNDAETAAEPAVLETGNERILLVDDELPIVKLEKQMLERLGYTVSTRTSSSDALELFKTNPNAYDLLITDMSMPQMTGEQLAKGLLKIRNDIPIIIYTGFSERLNEEGAKAMGVKGFLMKPVIKSDMAKEVRKVLDEAKVYKEN